VKRCLAAPVFGVTLVSVRPLAALVLAPLLTLAIAVGAIRLVGGLSTSPQIHAQGVVWGKRLFVSRAAFGRWLESHGRSYEAWARRHPVAPPKPEVHGSSSRRSTMVLASLASGLGALELLLLVRRRRLVGRLRPRLGSSYDRAHSVTLLAWHEHPDLAWYVAGGALAVGAGLAVAGLK
jgi:hypothetical protein